MKAHHQQTFRLENLESRQLLASTPVLWSHDPYGKLYTVNVGTGQATVIGSMGVVMYDIAFSPSGQLFGISDGGVLYKINKSTAAVTNVGYSGGEANALVFATDGTLYGAGSDSFFKLNTSTGVRTTVGDLDGHSSAGDIAFDGSGKLYMSATDNHLYRVDRFTGNTTDLGDTGFSEVLGLAYASNGVMYGISNSERKVFSLNLTTGKGTAIATLSSNVSGAYGSSFIDEAARPEIEVRGNNVVINDGDTSPSTGDFTDFGSTAVSGGTVTRTFTVKNTGNATLTFNGSRVTIDGTNAADFKIVTTPPASLAAGASASFQIRFDPSASGTRTANVHVLSNDANEGSYDFAVKGNGTGITVPTVGVTAKDPNAAESVVGPTSSGLFKISRSTTAGSLAVQLKIAGTGTLNTDYKLTVYGASTSAINATSKTISLTFGSGVEDVYVLLTVLNDSTTESTETSVLSLVSSSTYAVTGGSATVNIGDE